MALRSACIPTTLRCDPSAHRASLRDRRVDRRSVSHAETRAWWIGAAAVRIAISTSTPCCVRHTRCSRRSLRSRARRVDQSGPSQRLREQLARIGREGEVAMLRATEWQQRASRGDMDCRLAVRGGGDDSSAGRIANSVRKPPRSRVSRTVSRRQARHRATARALSERYGVAGARGQAAERFSARASRSACPRCIGRVRDGRDRKRSAPRCVARDHRDARRHLSLASRRPRRRLSAAQYGARAAVQAAAASAMAGRAALAAPRSNV